MAIPLLKPLTDSWFFLVDHWYLAFIPVLFVIGLWGLTYARGWLAFKRIQGTAVLDLTDWDLLVSGITYSTFSIITMVSLWLVAMASTWFKDNVFVPLLPILVLVIAMVIFGLFTMIVAGMVGTTFRRWKLKAAEQEYKLVRPGLIESLDFVTRTVIYISGAIFIVILAITAAGRGGVVWERISRFFEETWASWVFIIILLVIMQFSARFVSSIMREYRRRDSHFSLEMIDLTRRALLGLIYGGVGLMVIFVVVTDIFQIAGVENFSLILVVLAIGVTVILATTGVAKNLISGVTLIRSDLVNTGERIEVAGHLGMVERITLTHTELRLDSGQLALVPNEVMGSQVIVNHSRARRIVKNLPVPEHLTLDLPELKDHLREIFHDAGVTSATIRDLRINHEIESTIVLEFEEDRFDQQRYDLALARLNKL